MTSHGFIRGTRRSNEDEIAKAVFDAGKTVGAKGIEIYFFDKNEKPMNTLVKFDCHNDDGSANPKRVAAFAAELKNACPRGTNREVDWAQPLIIIAEHARP